MTDTLPAGLTSRAMSGTGWSCTLATLTCTRSDALAAGASYAAITLTVDVATSAPASVTNSATVSGGGETNTANDTASDPTTISPAGATDLTLTKTRAGNFTQGQTGASYALTVSNAGTAASSGTVTMTDTLPAGRTSRAMSGSGWSCTLATLTCTRSDALAAGASYPGITVTVDVAVHAPASVTNAASVSGGGCLNSPCGTVNDPTTITQVAALTITKSHAGNFTQGDTSDGYTLNVKNTGDGANTGLVKVGDTIPAGLTAA